MTVKRWSLTLLAFGLSLLWFLYCVHAVRSAWGLVSMGVLLVMSFRLLLNTVDLCCGQWLRGRRLTSVAPPVRVRRIILEEITTWGEAEGPLPGRVGYVDGAALWRGPVSHALAQPVAPRRVRHGTNEASTYER